MWAAFRPARRHRPYWLEPAASCRAIALLDNELRIGALTLTDSIVHTAIIGGDPLFREGLRRILEDTRYSTDVIATSLEDAMRYANAVHLMLLLEFDDGDPQFLDGLAALRAKWPNARVVAIVDNRSGQLVAALKAGVHGYLARYISAEALLRFLALIVLGQRVFSTKSLNLPIDLDSMVPAEAPRQGWLAARIDSIALSQRERAMLSFLVEGRSNKVIARQLGIAEATVKAQMARLFGKIGASNRTHAAVLAWMSHRGPQCGSMKLAQPK
jgi:two-component system, NarL family, nitrate/nitrite response regulator NarL